ncbi:hypothetical protein M378DRAFT_181855 [Amanita muscaria Koide BX008]|uniref:Uncharacterized protein n=1 Tax=Amanita muscaria (strain Koide BX008) TaxID=946122 RepID=A0A0C2SRY4_AMAMK|nr:hypothetical protein M378DRAFT_181855 [Amanita muscaria Koide BX008]
MSGSPNDSVLNLHISLGNTFTYKQVSIPQGHQLSIGAVRDKAITEMELHLKSHNLQPKTMPTPDNVQIFEVRDLNKTKASPSVETVVAVIPPPPGFSAIDELIDAKLERMKSEYQNQLKGVKSEYQNQLKEVERRLEEAECKHEHQLSNLQAQQQDLDNWIIMNTGIPKLSMQ